MLKGIRNYRKYKTGINGDTFSSRLVQFDNNLRRRHSYTNSDSIISKLWDTVDLECLKREYEVAKDCKHRKISNYGDVIHIPIKK